MMFSTLVLAVALASGSATSGVASPEVWAPMNAFVGAWSGTRVTPTGTVNVARQYEAASGNHHLQVTEQVGHTRSPWGAVSFDEARGSLVLRRSAAAGTVAAELFLTAVSEDRSRLVFTSEPKDGSASERLTLQRYGWNQFVERLETTAGGDDFKLIYETKFRRKE